eukprot:471230-Prymnesium_polylepis.1
MTLSAPRVGRQFAILGGGVRVLLQRVGTWERAGWPEAESLLLSVRVGPDSPGCDRSHRKRPLWASSTRLPAMAYGLWCAVRRYSDATRSCGASPATFCCPPHRSARRRRA